VRGEQLAQCQVADRIDISGHTGKTNCHPSLPQFGRRDGARAGSHSKSISAAVGRR
jgi:hypothetical protein